MSNYKGPIIVCGFPGTGKSFLADQLKCHDSDSSSFSWLEPGVRNPLFPKNYIEHILGLRGLVLASTHKDVRNRLRIGRIPFWICYPDRECKDEYLDRYRARKSPDEFLALLAKNWDLWIGEMEAEGQCAGRIILGANEYLADILAPGIAKGVQG